VNNEEFKRYTIERIRELVKERDEARADFLRVAEGLGMVNADDTGRIGEVASADELVEHAREAQRRWMQWDEMEEYSMMACENPPTGCECNGCSLAREKSKEVAP
jgi:hypothetical protein